MNTPLPVTAPVWAMQLIWEMTTSYTGWWYAQECVWCKNVTILCLQSFKKLPFYFLACIWTNLNSLRCTTPEDLHATLQTTTAIFLLIQSTIFLLNFLSLLILCLRSLKKLLFYFLLVHCPCSICSWFAISKFQAKTLLMCVSSSSLHKNKSKCYCPWLKKKPMLRRCNWETDRQTHTDTHRQGPEAQHFYVLTLSNDVLPAFSLDIQLISELNQDCDLRHKEQAELWWWVNTNLSQTQ
jgi:hypothetical protein